MDFMKILKSLEEFLYEVMVWLVFYPITLWQVIFRPSAMMDYAEDELDDADEDRYSDRLSPPIFLVLTLGLTHGLELALGVKQQSTALLANDQNLVAFRVIAFSVFPLVLAVRLLRGRGQSLDRKVLRAPFYSQCFVAAPFAAIISMAPIVVPHLPIQPLQQLMVILGVFLFATVWYLMLQARWFARRLEISVVRGHGHALTCFIQALLLVTIISAIVDSI